MTYFIRDFATHEIYIFTSRDEIKFATHKIYIFFTSLDEISHIHDKSLIILYLSSVKWFKRRSIQGYERLLKWCKPDLTHYY